MFGSRKMLSARHGMSAGAAGHLQLAPPTSTNVTGVMSLIPRRRTRIHRRHVRPGKNVYRIDMESGSPFIRWRQL